MYRSVATYCTYAAKVATVKLRRVVKNAVKNAVKTGSKPVQNRVKMALRAQARKPSSPAQLRPSTAPGAQPLRAATMPSTRSGSSSGAVTASAGGPDSPSSSARQAYAGTRMTPAAILADLRAKKAKRAFRTPLFEPVLAPFDDAKHGGFCCFRCKLCHELFRPSNPSRIFSSHRASCPEREKADLELGLPSTSSPSPRRALPFQRSIASYAAGSLLHMAD